MLDGVLAGEIALPAGEIPEPFIDADDIADVAVAALTEDGHTGQLYEIDRAARAPLRRGRRRNCARDGTPDRLSLRPASGLHRSSEGAGLPDEMLLLMQILFGEVLDGRNVQSERRCATRARPPAAGFLRLRAADRSNGSLGERLEQDRFILNRSCSASFCFCA